LNLGLNLLTVAVLVAASGVAPRLSWLELPLLVALLVVLAAGVAILLSALFVRLRDIAQIWTVVLQLLFFGSSVIYVVTEFPSALQELMIVNPLTMIFTEMRHALIDPSAPSAADVAGSTALLLLPLAAIAAVVAAGLWAFKRETPRMAESV
jgi:ABC-2 type transport system permease protein